jgi:hypothetical protein
MWRSAVWKPGVQLLRAAALALAVSVCLSGRALAQTPASTDAIDRADASQVRAELTWVTRLLLYSAGLGVQQTVEGGQKSAASFAPDPRLRPYLALPGGGGPPSGAPAGWPLVDIARVWATGFSYTLMSLGPLLYVDGAATAWTLAVALGRMALVLVPAVLLIKSVRWWHRLWLIPVVALGAIMITPIGLSYGATIGEWVLLVLVAVSSSLLRRVPVLRWTGLLPFVIVSYLVPRHTYTSMFVDDPGFREQLFAACAHVDGVRPRNLSPDLVMPFHGINLVNDDLLLLTGEGRFDGSIIESWWLRRKDGRWEFESPVRYAGYNLWRGCKLDGTIWMGMNGRLKGVKRLPEGSEKVEEVYDAPIPASDYDFGEAACEPDRGRIYVGEASKGGLWETDRDGSNPRRHHVGGIVMLSERRFDGRIIVDNSGSFLVFDPDEQRVIERVPAGLADFGFDVCDKDGSVAVPDALGRLRIFELDASGHYRFAWGLNLFASRRVAFSWDCSRLAVTSADDRHVYIVDAASRQLVNVFNTGPALREVMATGPREFSITDACSMTSYQW